MPPPPSTGIQIGEVLQAARRRRDLDIEAVAEQTKIRAKYLRALEAEDWATLPNPAYAKGFLRTYARLLGLDADALVDEYRRRVGDDAQPERLLPFGEPVLEPGWRPVGIEEPSRWRGPILAVLATAAIAIVLVLVIAGGLGRERSHHRHHHRHHGGGSSHAHRTAGASSGPMAMSLRTRDGIQLCLVSSSRALIDSQALAPGAKAGPFHGRRFRLDLDSFGGGNLVLRVNGRASPIKSKHRASFRVAPGGVSKIGYRGPRCP